MMNVSIVDHPPKHGDKTADKNKQHGRQLYSQILGFKNAFDLQITSRN